MRGALWDEGGGKGVIDVGDAMFVDGRSASQALPSSLGGCVLLLYRYIIIANCFFLFSGVLGRDHLVFSLSLSCIAFLVEGVGGLYTYLDSPTRRVLGDDDVGVDKVTRAEQSITWHQ